MLKILRILLYVCVTPAFAQIDMFNMLEKKYILDLERESFPALNFQWNFDGKVQGAVNAGLTELMDNKDYEKAFQHFDEAIVKLPTCLPAFYYRGICYKILDKLENARTDLSKAAALAPDRPEIFLELGEVYELQYKYADAEKMYEKAIELDAQFASAYFNMANLSMRQQLPGKANRYFKKCLEVDPAYVKSHVRQGLLAYGLQRKASRTILHFDNALAIDSTFQAALFWRGMMHLRDKNVEECLADWNKLVQYNPDNSAFIMLRAFLYLDLEKYDEAFLDLKNLFSEIDEDENSFRGAQSDKDKTLDLQFAVSYIARTIYGLKDDAASALKKGFCFMVMERRPDATRELKKSFALQPSSLSLFLNAMNYEHSEKHDSAFYAYGDALKYDNDIFDAHKKRAIYFSELKDWKSANIEFEHLLRLQPGMTVTYRLRSLVRIDFKDYYGAINDLTRALEIDSTDHEIYLYRAYCRKAVNDLLGENIDYRKALEVDPERYVLYENVIRSDLQIKDTTHAMQTLQVCEEKFGFQTYLLSTRVRIFIDQKNYDDARADLKKFTGDKFWLSMRPNSEHSLIYFLDGWIDFLQNEEQSAIRKLNKALELHPQNLEAMYLRSKIFLARGDRMKAINDLKTLAAAGYSDSERLLNDLR